MAGSLKFGFDSDGELEMTEYPDSRHARADIASYLAYYNHERRHSALDYLAPEAFEAQLPQLK